MLGNFLSRVLGLIKLLHLVFEKILRRFFWCWLVVVVVVSPQRGFLISGVLFHATGTSPWRLRPIPPQALSSTSTTMLAFTMSSPQPSFSSNSFRLLICHVFLSRALRVLRYRFLPPSVFYVFTLLMCLSLPTNTWIRTSNVLITNTLT